MRAAAHRATLVLALAALGPGSPPAPARCADRGPELERYVDLVERYASGDRKEAVSGLGQWRERDIEAATELLAAWSRGEASGPSGASQAAFGTFPVAAAALMHAERAEAEASRKSIAFHVARARFLAALHPASAPPRDFVRRLYVVLTLGAYGQMRWDLALDLAARGLRLFPGEPELLLALGSIEETPGFLGLLGVAEAPTSFARGSLTGRALWERTEQRRHLGEAASAFARAAAGDPALLEARLRLGRVLWRQGEFDRAREHLLAVVTGSGDADLLYLAHLFLGRIHEDAGRTAEASREYGTARDLLPRAQTPHLALAHLRHSASDDPSMREAILRALEPFENPRDDDPFWRYGWGRSAEAAARFDSLVTEAAR